MPFLCILLLCCAQASLFADDTLPVSGSPASLFEQGLYAEALSLWEQEIAHGDSATVGDALFGIARSRERLQDFAGAAEIYRLYLAVHPFGTHASESQFGYGTSLRHSGKNREACTALARFARSFPDNRLSSEAALIAAQAAVDIADTVAADSLFSLAAELRPGSYASTEAAVALVARAVDRRSFDRAELLLKREKRRFRTDPSVLMRLSWQEARLYRGKGDVVGAARLLKGLLERDISDIPEKTAVYAGAVDALNAAGRADDASALFMRFFKTLPPNDLGPDFLLGGADALFSRRRFTEAKAAYEVVSGVWPGTESAAQARFRLAYVYLDESDTAGACSLFVSLADGETTQVPLRQTALHMLGEIAFSGGRYVEAAGRFSREAFDYNDENARLMCARSYARNSERAKALAEYEQLWGYASSRDIAGRAAYEAAVLNDRIGLRSLAEQWFGRARESGFVNDSGSVDAGAPTTATDVGTIFPGPESLSDIVKSVDLDTQIAPATILSVAEHLGTLFDSPLTVDRLFRRVILESTSDSLSFRAALSMARICREYSRLSATTDTAGRLFRDSARAWYAVADRYVRIDKDGVVSWERMHLNGIPAPDSLRAFIARHPASPYTLNAHLSIGLRLESDSSKYAVAASHFRSAAAASDTLVSVPSFFGLLRCMTRMGQLDSARLLLAGVSFDTARSDMRAERRFEEALVAERENAFATAADRYRKSYEAHAGGPRFAEALLFEIRVLQKGGRMQAAIASARTALLRRESVPIRELIQYELGHALSNAGMLDEAIAIFTRLSRSTAPVGVTATRELAAAYESKSDLENARDAYILFAKRRAGEEGVASLLKAGWLSIDMRDGSGALQIFRQAHASAISPNDSAYSCMGAAAAETMTGVGDLPWHRQFDRRFRTRYSGLRADLSYRDGVVLFTRGEIDKALVQFHNCCEELPAGPRVPDAIFRIGSILLATDPAAAMESFTRVATDFPASPAAALALFKAGTISYDGHDFRAAADAFERSARHPLCDELTRRTAVANGAAAYQKLSLWTDAARLYGILLAKDDDPGEYAITLLKRGFCYFQAGRIDESIADYRQASARARREDRAEAQYWVAASLSRKGDIDNAIAEYLKVPYLYSNGMPWGLTAEFEAARLYEKTGRIPAAIALYRKVLASDGVNGAFGEKASRRIEAITPPHSTVR